MLAYRLVVGNVFRALADPTRREILDELRERDDQTLFELCVRLATKHGLGSTRQAVSQHLDVLEDAGLVSTWATASRCRQHGSRLRGDLQWLRAVVG
jgi:DNA-binding transcriptional ArsR family regulator